METSKPVTVEEAQTVELSMNPFRRLGQLSELGAGLSIGFNPLPLCMTRRSLVRMAEIHAEAERIVAYLEEAELRSKEG